MFWPPPRSTLFPYTTLFRSVSRTERSTPCPPDPLPMIPTSSSGPVKIPPCTTDRKSTRLNSSHVKNSYAVFCLKKKSHGGYLLVALLSSNDYGRGAVLFYLL